MLYAGVDTHKKYSRVVVTDSRGQMVAQASLSNDIASFKDFFLKMSEPLKAVVEAGRTWGIIYDMLEDLGAEPVLANPLKARAIAEAKIKTDSIDARTLADLLRADLIPAVHVPSREVRAQKNLLRQRLWLVGIRTMVKNRIHHILDRNHVVMSQHSGLVPSTYASGGKVRHGGLISSCNRWLKWAFVEAAWIAQRTSPYCHEYFERIKWRKGANSAATALARRLCEITWHCLSGNRPYEERVCTRLPSAVLGRNGPLT